MGKTAGPWRCPEDGRDEEIKENGDAGDDDDDDDDKGEDAGGDVGIEDDGDCKFGRVATGRFFVMVVELA